jgi:hypothetical protein
MAKKTQDIKTYLSTIGTTEQLHLFVGNTLQTIDNNSEDSTKELWKSMIFSKRMSREDVVGVIPNITWTAGNVYYPWSSTTTNSGAYYAWNKETGIVYLCLDNNDMNRLDLSGTVASTYAPTHSYGIQKYADGYTWLPIYRITSDYLRFVKNEWIPVISFEDYEENAFSTDYAAAENFCAENFNESGYCSLYFKSNTNLQVSGITFEYYAKGDLYTTLPSYCSECFYLYENNTTFQNVFNLSSSDVASSIEINDKLTTIGNNIANNRLSPSSAFYALYQIAMNGPSDGAILSATIDLTGIEADYLTVNTPNPYLTVSTYTGSGAVIRLKTTTTIDGRNQIQGIEVLENGSGYREASLSIDSTIFTNIDASDLILSSISLNLDIIDGLNVDPYDVLNCTNVMVDARIDTSDLLANNITLPPTINLFGLVSNPLELASSGDYIVSGSDLPKNATKLKSGLTELGVIATVDVSAPSSPPSVLVATGISEVNNKAGSGIASTNVLKASLIPSTVEALDISIPNESFVTLVGYNYENIDASSKVIDGNYQTYNVSRVITKPDIKQYSGSIIQTKKTSTDIKLASGSSTNSKIIRINIIKGL